jgi:hypothetical protein
VQSDSGSRTDLERDTLVGSALRLSYFTIVWNGVVGATALVVGLSTGSLALAGFALNALSIRQPRLSSSGDSIESEAIRSQPSTSSAEHKPGSSSRCWLSRATSAYEQSVRSSTAHTPSRRPSDSPLPRSRSWYSRFSPPHPGAVEFVREDYEGEGREGSVLPDTSDNASSVTVVVTQPAGGSGGDSGSAAVAASAVKVTPAKPKAPGRRWSLRYA